MPKLIEGAKRDDELVAFLVWVKTVPRDQLDNLLADAYWKGHLEESELQRFFECSQRGVNLLHQPVRRKG